MSVKSSSVRRILDSGQQRLNERFTAREKRSVMRQLLMLQLQCDEESFLLHQHDELDGDQVAEIETMVEAINSGRPVQYVLGTTYFYNVDIQVDETVLIPRPETEELVHHTLQFIREKGMSHPRILDVGTGSGCIAIALAKALPSARVKGVDDDENILKLARKNAKGNGVDAAFELVDALAELDRLDAVDVVVSNPPYIPVVEKSSIQPHVLDFEPEKALFVPDETPLLFYRAIAEQSLQLLNVNGFLIFECHESFAREVQQLMTALEYSNSTVINDIQGKERMVYGQKLT